MKKTKGIFYPSSLMRGKREVRSLRLVPEWILGWMTEKIEDQREAREMHLQKTEVTVVHSHPCLHCLLYTEVLSVIVHPMAQSSGHFHSLTEGNARRM